MKRVTILLAATTLVAAGLEPRLDRTFRLGAPVSVACAQTTAAPAADTSSRAAPAPARKTRSGAPKARRPKGTGGRNTIAPFPVPGDTSRAATERRKTLNIPKAGVTTIAPLPVPPGAGSEPEPGAVVPPQQVDVLPEAITRVPPFYPDAAREGHIQGTVVVGARVTTEGLVDSVRIARSIPGLDSAAMAAVRQWRFKPASFQGKPVAVWTFIPVKFSLH